MANKLVGGIYGPSSLYFQCNIVGAPLLIIAILLLFFGTSRSSAVPRWPSYLLIVVPVLVLCAVLLVQDIGPILAEHAFPQFFVYRFGRLRGGAPVNERRWR